MNAVAQPMQRGKDGWFSLDVACGAGTRYVYRISADLSVPDPASRAQDGDVFDPSVVVDQQTYAWRNTRWYGRPWHEAVIYELHIGAMGGYTAAMARLPDLAELGITAIELMPIGDFSGGRNWGYDGVLPFAPDAAYGPPHELKTFIDRAHGLGLMVFLDVVYNHFGPEGNFLHHYASSFFREDIQTPWGAAIDFTKPQVRQFFIENALYWLQDYRFDGLRIDAAHAFHAPEMLDELAARVRATLEPIRQVHLILENDNNIASHLERNAVGGYNAQWNDDVHHALHVMLTGEANGYYADYAEHPAQDLARALREGFVYQGQPSAYRDGRKRGEPSAHLPPTSFVHFLQCHDQIGNRAFGERITSLADLSALRAAVALQLLSPQIPMLFMGEEWGSTQPFHYFTAHGDELAKAVWEGRQTEFSVLADLASGDPLPDANSVDTFRASIPDWDRAHTDPYPRRWLAFYKELLALRTRHVIPRLEGAVAVDSQALGPKAVSAQWRMNDGSILSITTNLDQRPVRVRTQADAKSQVIFESTPDAAEALASGELRACTTIASLSPK
jgi:malto-oligosyltrehalose trehalohydrolase